MEIIEGNNIEECYEALISELLSRKLEDNGTREILNCNLVVYNPTTEKIFFPYRKISETYSNEELKWYWSGDNRCETIGKFAKMWLKLTDDGVTNNSAYGYILFKKYGFDQLQQIIELLKKDKNSRRAVLNISDPAINRIETKDMQCTIAIQFIVRDNTLEETVYMRSNDVYFGLPYDYIFFVSLGEYIAEKLNLKLSKYTHVATSMHMYERDIEKFVEHDNHFNIDVKKIIKENYDYEK